MRNVPIFMARAARVFASNCYYHVICRGNNRQIVFHDGDDFSTYLFLLGKYKTEHPCSLFHYALMNNHVHLLLEPSTPEALSRLMLKVNLTYSQHFQKKYGGVGHLWQGRYKSILVANDRYCLTCAAYIELNSVSAGIVTTPDEYPWTSYRFYAHGVKDRLLTPNPMYLGLADHDARRQALYREYVAGVQETKQIQEEAMDNFRYFGDMAFVRAMEQTTGIAAQAKRGRPRREK